MGTPSTSRWPGRSRRICTTPTRSGRTRPPLVDDVTVAVIGGGFAGLITGARLRQAGIDDFRIIEKGGDFGGTWYWNRYPGAQCDVESYVYLPLLEETSYVPSEKYVRAPEILEHCRRIAEHFDLYERACLSTEVTAIAWDAARWRWIIHTNRGDRMSARFLVMGNGPLHRPKLPGIPGIEDVRGSCVPHQPVGLRVHRRRLQRRTARPGRQARRDHRHRRHGRPGRSARRRLRRRAYVFQRTPSSIDVRANRPTDASWAASLEPGWQRRENGELHAPDLRRLRRGGPRDGRLDRHHRKAGHEAPRPAPGSGRRPGQHPGAGRLREDGADPGAGGRHRHGPGDRGGPEALVPAVLQAPLLPRRVPAGVQPSERLPGGHRRARASTRSRRTG